MKIRAKMECHEVTRMPWGAEYVKLMAVHTGTPEDNTYAAATPSGHVQLTIDNPDAQGAFKRGKKYYVDFIEAP